jgi:glycosyltransferase involved in cell wall biosynthesis
MEIPTVSIVMRAKNEMPYIQKTLQAFQEQTFQDL